MSSLLPISGRTAAFTGAIPGWSRNTVRYRRSYTFRGKTVTRIEIDPDKRVPDVDRTNNVWGSAPSGPRP